MMSNHYHLLVETPLGNLSQIMRHVNGSYTAYFNAKRSRSGHLFQGRYKAILVERDEYAGELSRYIHLNPVRANMTENPEEYGWSSYGAYIGKCKTPKWLTEEIILGYFGHKEQVARKNYREFVNGLMGKEYESPLGEAVAGCILGRGGFIERIKKLYLEERGISRDVPAVREIKGGPSLAEIRDAVKLVMVGNERALRKAALFISHRFSGKTLKEIGKEYGISESGVSQASSRFGKVIARNIRLAKKVQKVSQRLGLSTV